MCASPETCEEVRRLYQSHNSSTNISTLSVKSRMIRRNVLGLIATPPCMGITYARSIRGVQIDGVTSALAAELESKPPHGAG